MEAFEVKNHPASNEKSFDDVALLFIREECFVYQQISVNIV
jgi:hypothetical protein